MAFKGSRTGLGLTSGPCYYIKEGITLEDVIGLLWACGHPQSHPLEVKCIYFLLIRFGLPCLNFLPSLIQSALEVVFKCSSMLHSPCNRCDLLCQVLCWEQGRREQVNLRSVRHAGKSRKVSSCAFSSS